MNKEDFKRLVSPYLNKSLLGQASELNKELILRDFKPYLPTNRGDGMLTVSELNKLIYIPDVWNKGKGYLIFSNESETYIYKPQSSLVSQGSDWDTWYVSTSSAGWSNIHNWIMREASITDMNRGNGWNMGSNVTSLYYALELYERIQYLNWTIGKNPLNLK